MSNRRIQYVLHSAASALNALESGMPGGKNCNNIFVVVAFIKCAEIIVRSFVDESETEMVQQVIKGLTEKWPQDLINHRMSTSHLSRVCDFSTIAEESEMKDLQNAMTGMAAGINYEYGIQCMMELSRRVEVNITDRFSNDVEWRKLPHYLNNCIYEVITEAWGGRPNFDDGPFPWLQAGYIMLHAHWMLSFSGVVKRMVPHNVITDRSEIKSWANPVFNEFKINPDIVLDSMPIGVAYSLPDLIDMSERIYYSRANSLSKNGVQIVQGLALHGEQFAKEILNRAPLH